MTAEEITLEFTVPEPLTIARTLEVRCGESRVTVRQVMGTGDDEWTVYEGDSFDIGRNKGLVGKVANAPTAGNAEAVIPWAADLVVRRERRRLAVATLQGLTDDQPHAVEEPDE